MTSFILILLAIALLVHMLRSFLRMERRLAAPPRTGGAARGLLPSITVIRPIKGLDVGARENTEALLNQDYPGPVETLFVLDSAQDPAYPVVAQIVAASRKD